MSNDYEYYCYDTAEKAWEYLESHGYAKEYYNVIRIIFSDELKKWNVTKEGFYIYSHIKRKLLKWR